MLPEEQNVQGCEPRLLVGSQITRFETRVALGRAADDLLVGRSRRQQLFVFLAGHCVQLTCSKQRKYCSNLQQLGVENYCAV